MKNFSEYTKEELNYLISNSISLSEVLRKMNRKTNHGNFRTLKRYCFKHNINLSNILNNRDKYKNSGGTTKKIPINEILVSGSTYANTSNLKHRLYCENLKQPICELCGQNEIWKGKKMSLILDHINGVHNDNRIENLQIVCPNCNATLPTHGGKNTKLKREQKNNVKIVKTNKNKKNIEKINGVSKNLLISREKTRKVERPEYDVLLNDIFYLGYLGTGKKYGVSDNAIRKWVKYYEKYNINWDVSPLPDKE